MEAQVINHLGLISAEYEKIGIHHVLNKIFPKHENSKLTVNNCVKALVLNSFGFTGKPLYLTANFFKNKPTEMLIGKGITSDMLFDDSLGRALDAIYEVDPTLLFSQIAYRAARIYNIDTNILHGDTSSKIMFGSYEPVEGQPEIVKYGYSKDKRPDLKQLMFSLLISNEGSFPLFGGIIPGNTSDSVHFREACITIRDNLNLIRDKTIVVFDSKLHTDINVHELADISWVTRVPDTTNLAKKTVTEALKLPLEEIIKGYSGVESVVKHGGIKQRWLVVRSEKSHESGKQSVSKAVKNEKKSFEKELKKMNKEGFSCASDAMKGLEEKIKKLKYHRLDTYKLTEKVKFLKRGKPTSESPKKSIFSLVVTLAESPNDIQQAIKKAGCFVIGTNVLDTEELSTEDLLKTYKDQYKVERGFRYLKNPVCMARAVYLKKQSRIVALGFIMLINLLIYSAIEYAARRALKEHDETVLNQLKKPTQQPTARWLFELFEDVVIITVYQAGKELMKKVVNLRDELKKLLRLLGPAYCQMYLLS